MRRLGRYIFNALTVLSLLLCVATVASLRFQIAFGEPDEASLQRTPAGSTIPARVIFIGNAAFVYGNMKYYVGDREIVGGPDWSIIIPPPIPSAITGILPSLWLLKRRNTISQLLGRVWTRNQKQVLDLCDICGYDLRATPDRCPECGTISRIRAE